MHHLETSLWLRQEHILYSCFICNLLLVIIVWNGSIYMILCPLEPKCYSQMLLKINTQTAMTKPMWEKAPFHTRHGHNTVPTCFLKVTRSRLLVIFLFYWHWLCHGENSLLLLNDHYIRILMNHFRYKKIGKTPHVMKLSGSRFIKKVFFVANKEGDMPLLREALSTKSTFFLQEWGAIFPLCNTNVMKRAMKTRFATI